jgi:hypothetical protein
MNDDDTRYEAIHQYLLDEMDAATRAAFEQQLATDAQLAEAVALEREVLALLRQQRRLEIKAMLRDTPVDAIDAHDNPPIVPPRRNRGGIHPPFYKLIGIITAIAACVIVAFFIFKPDAAPDFVSLYELAFVENYGRDVSRVPEAPLPLGYAAYNDGNWETAIAQLSPIVDSLPEASIMYGIAAMHLKRWQDAQSTLLPIEELGVQGYSIMATWYLALIDLQAGNVAECKRRLRRVQADGNYKKLAAENLMEELGGDSDDR